MHSSTSMNRWDVFRLGFAAAVTMMALGLLSSGRSIHAQEPNGDERVDEALEITTGAARLYEFRQAGGAKESLAFAPDSVLRWSNPEAGEIYGNVYFWTRQGRPEVVGSFLQWYSPFTHGSHEFQSLSTQRIVGSRDGQNVWSTEQAGVSFTLVSGAPAVADSAIVRLRQARSMARKFQVRRTDRDGKTGELRLLAQPLARYGNDESQVLDGGLFAFVQGTDPEVFLLLEARKHQNDWQWHFALARMNSVQFVATHRDRTVWQTEILPWSEVKSGLETYTSFGPFESDPPAPKIN